MNRILSALKAMLLFGLLAAFLHGCGTEVLNRAAGMPPREASLGISEGYLTQKELPNSLLILPPPPAMGSPAFARDEEASRQALALQGTPRWEQAKKDADLTFPHAAELFSCALDIAVSSSETPRLIALLERTMGDAGYSTAAAKRHYKRLRPFLTNGMPTCTPEWDARLSKSGSYPSGHSSLGWAWALVLAEVAPDRADEVLIRGRAFGESRIVCNVHWESDVSEGRVIGAATVARLHANPAFREAIETAKEEVKNMRARGRRPTADCPKERELPVQSGDAARPGR